MSTISNIQSNSIYNFSIEKPTQSMQKKLLIEQSEHQGLKVSFADGAKVQPIERYMLNGLPKTSLVPQEFFDACHATLSEGGRVNFVLGLKGGMQSNQDNDLNGLIDSLRANLENDYEKDLSEEEIDTVLTAMRTIITTDKDQVEQKGKEVLSEMQSNTPELVPALDFCLKRSEGKYPLFLVLGPLALTVSSGGFATVVGAIGAAAAGIIVAAKK